ncbi:hypothetical protein ACJX0J_005884 [Zea mays]
MFASIFLPVVTCLRLGALLGPAFLHGNFISTRQKCVMGLAGTDVWEAHLILARAMALVAAVWASDQTCKILMEIEFNGMTFLIRVTWRHKLMWDSLMLNFHISYKKGLSLCFLIKYKHMILIFKQDPIGHCPIAAIFLLYAEFVSHEMVDFFFLDFLTSLVTVYIHA